MVSAFLTARYLERTRFLRTEPKPSLRDNIRRNGTKTDVLYGRS